MEICEQSQAFVEKGGDLVFDHTKIIVKGEEEDEYFYARVPHRLGRRSSGMLDVDLGALDLVRIPTDNVWPKLSPDLTQAPHTPPPENSYLKQPSLLYYGDSDASLGFDEHLLDEAKVCEILKQNPHPNIVTYWGCIARGGRIRGLCFARYPQTLAQRMRVPLAEIPGTSRAGPLDVDACLRGIRSGVAHLHGLGLIHNDLNPANIMMDELDNPVIIDFDSCKRMGEKLGLKAGTVGWEMTDLGDVAKPENDEYGIAKLEAWLRKEAKAKG